MRSKEDEREKVTSEGVRFPDHVEVPTRWWVICMHPLQGEYGSVSYQGKSIGLLRPTTFMNLSGQSVSKVSETFHSTLDASPV